jgi:hypothetical protein
MILSLACPSLGSGALFGARRDHEAGVSIHHSELDDPYVRRREVPAIIHF